MRLPRPALFFLCTAFLACGGSSDSPTGLQPLPGSRAELTVAPVDLSAQGYIEPLGHLAPYPHTIPTDHIYFIQIDGDLSPIQRDTLVRDVRAPARGVVNLMIQPSNIDWKIAVLVTNDFVYYVDHVNPVPGIQVGSVVHAGDIIAHTNPGGGVDLGAWDLSTPRLPGLANTLRYGEPTLHTVSPIKYFTEPVRSQLYARVRRARTAPDLDGKTDWDIKGRLVASWYEEGLSYADSQGPLGWPRQIAFVYDNTDPSIPRVSIGGVISGPFLGTVAPGGPKFEDVSIASGVVTYSVRYTRETTFQFGLMLVQMLAEDRVKVEMFEGNLVTSAAFDAKAHVFVR